MKLIKLLCAVIAILGLTSVTFSNHSLDDSQKVADLSAEIAALEKSNKVLVATVADAGSLTKLAEKIETMGFVAPEKVASINGSAAVALK